MMHQANYVFVALGSNCDRVQNLSAALDALSQRFGELLISPVYASAAEGFEGAEFYNAVVGFRKALSLEAIVVELKAIEAANCRVRGVPRVSLDLDLLLYGGLVLETSTFVVPHPDILTRSFVLKPLADIAPDLRHPGIDLNYAELWKRKRGSVDELVDVSSELKVNPFGSA